MTDGPVTAVRRRAAGPDRVRTAATDRPAHLYARLLDLRHLHLRGWQRAVLAEGTVVAAVLLVLADLASAWTVVALPLAVAAVVKAHDLLAGALTAQTDGAVPVGERRRREVRAG